ncbi:hypothetical protein QTP81_01360 [Alteromonas sp. ASW11-36]|uniref:Uncharacterized protein n=1 Tax=Alteromonas arenosi TaxID=3055817 RepID=A0ABT7SSW9_9ALTE|nr:hypothetical protein [Alteromonas sp. ASW11-36]MDM7859251.1 hypothetical protein [Alteromonas sp. ASW11-36]
MKYAIILLSFFNFAFANTVNVSGNQISLNNINILCSGFGSSNTEDLYQTITDQFMRNSDLTEEEFYSVAIFSPELVCPASGEQFLLHVMTRNPIDFERLLSQENVSYPEDIPREYRAREFKTLRCILTEYRALYVSMNWMAKFGLFFGLLENLGKAEKVDSSTPMKHNCKHSNSASY